METGRPAGGRRLTADDATPAEISDHRAITELLYRYARAIDGRDLDAFTTLFTPDAWIHYDVGGGTARPLPEMQAWLREALTIFRVTQHAMSNPSIVLHGDAAEATTYLTAMHVQVTPAGDESTVVQYGIYHDRLARTDAGWRITHRRLEHVHTHGTFLGPDAVRRFR